MASARSLTGATAPRALLTLIQGNKGTVLPFRALSYHSAGGVYRSLSINRLRHPPVLPQGVRCNAARGLTTASRCSIKMDIPASKFYFRRWRCFSDNAGGYGEQFDVTGSLLDARREGRDCPLPGQFLAVSHTFGQEAVAAFATLAGDNNPIHLDVEYARSAGPRMYEGCIVHGLLVASLFPTVFGRTISGSLYVSQSLRFEGPVLVGERVDARIEVQQARVTRMGREVLARCSTVACLADGSVAISGDAKVLLPRDWELHS